MQLKVKNRTTNKKAYKKGQSGISNKVTNECSNLNRHHCRDKTINRCANINSDSDFCLIFTNQK